MSYKLIECILNFSEGRDAGVIRRIIASVADVSGVEILHRHCSFDIDRLVLTFAGAPDAVCEAAFAGIAAASQLIDMRRYILRQPLHPCIGAADVCPLVPLQGVSMRETADCARRLARRVADALQIPVYCYAESAATPERRSLAFCRRGGYRSLETKLSQMPPDYGDARFTPAVAKTGATVIGARNPLLAVNFNLTAASVEPAAAIAAAIREKGDGARLKGVYAIGWQLPSRKQLTQVSVNITDFRATPLHRVYTEVCDRAAALGVATAGTDVVGLLPEAALLDDGRWYRTVRGASPDAANDALIAEARDAMQLSHLEAGDDDALILEDVLRKKFTGYEG
jgi:glutamate formiminotransferase/formiminotetrahydrofolate cyclodeaminase